MLPTCRLRDLRPLLLGSALAVGLGLGTTAAQAQDVDFSAMSPEQQADFEQAIRAYLLENPEVIYEAIQVLEARREQEQVAAEEELVAQYLGALHDTSYSWEGGNPEGDITVVEFLDYRCGFCKRAHPAVKEVLERDPNIRLIVREFPILGPNSVVAGRMAMAAYRLNADLYSALSDELMAFQGDLTETMAYRIAGQVGYDIAELKELAGSDEIATEIDKNYQLAEVLGIQGTPTFIIGSRIVRGFLPAETFLAAVEEERSSAAN
ncbi:MAG: DsbA family protein [Pseudomonadota bacterium]